MWPSVSCVTRVACVASVAFKPPRQKKATRAKTVNFTIFFEKRIRPPHPKSAKEGNPPDYIVPISRKEWTYIDLSNNPGAGWTLKGRN